MIMAISYLLSPKYMKIHVHLQATEVAVYMDQLAKCCILSILIPLVWS